MASSQRNKAQQGEAEMPDVRTPEESQLATLTEAEVATAVAGAQASMDYNNQAMQTFMDWLVARADSTDEDQFAMMAAIMGEIMAADNVADMMAERSTLSAKDVLNRPFLLHGFDIRAGDHEESLVQHYAAMHVSAPGSERTRVLTCGAMKVLMKLYKLEQFGEWPVLIMFTSKKGKKGDILDIVQP